MRDLIDNTVGPAIETKIIESDILWATLVESDQLENARFNMRINARDAMPDGARLTIGTIGRDRASIG